MASNSDKKLQDKLQGHSMPYDPQSWAAMEAMLDNKKKRRGIIWWWAGGIAASLLLGVGVYGVLQNEKMRKFGNEEMAEGGKAVQQVKNKNNETAQRTDNISTSVNTNTTVNSNETNTATSANSLTQNKEANTNTANIQSATSNQKVADNSAQQLSNTNNKLNTTKRHKAKNAGKNANINNNGGTNNTLASNQNNKRKQQTINDKQKKSATAQTEVAANTANENVIIEENPWAAVNAEIMLADELPVNLVDDITGSKREEEVFKKKKKIFHYSVGIAANITGTTLGKQDDMKPERPPLFYNKPSYGVGLTHDFLFVKRVALTNSILFSQTSFKVYSPNSISYDPAPQNYTCNITEVAIPVGVKVYPVSKRNFRFYVNAGITNHIKVAENFNYKQPVADPNYNDKSVLPTETSFDGAGNGVSQLGNAFTPSVIDVRTNTNDFSINNAKRYYASFYAGAGVEGIIKNHWLLFAEPTFSMAIPQIGVQEKRKYNVGVSGGFRYQF